MKTLASLCLAAVLTALFLTLPHAVEASTTPSEYEKAKVEMSRLLGDEKRAGYRHEWLKLADLFQEIYEQNDEWGNRPAALYRSAAALEEMARRSFVRKDAQNAAARYESLAQKHKSSVLADDALYKAACIRHELMRDTDDARQLLQDVQRKYAQSDYASVAKEYLNKLDGKDVASLSSGSSREPESAAAQIQNITPQVRGKVVRLVVSLDRPVSWRMFHQGGDTEGNNARLTLQLSGVRAEEIETKHRNQGPLVRSSISNTLEEGKTSLIFEFSRLRRYTVKAEKMPFRIIIEATQESNTLTSGIAVQSKNPPTVVKIGKTPAPPPRVDPKDRLTPPANLAAQLGLQLRTVVIDAGHGGKDPGTSHNKLVEREVTLDIAKKVGTALMAKGFKVVYTRDRNTWISLPDRAKLASQKKGDIFISIHVNASEKKDVSGVETYVLNLNPTTREAAHVAALENMGSTRSLGEMNDILADLMVGAKVQESTSLAKSIHKATVREVRNKSHKVKDGGVKGAPFQVLMVPSMPSILIEVGYCTNTSEAKLLARADYRTLLAKGIAQGVVNYAEHIKVARK